MQSSNPTRARLPPNERHPEGDDSWIDRVADEVQALLREHGLEMELCVFFDSVAEHLHAVGFDGSGARYFRSLEDPKGGGERAVGRGPSPVVATQVLGSSPP